MIACYDLARCPPTYDVVAFLAHAELERLRRKEDYIDLHILPGPASGFRQDSLWPRTVEERVRMRDRVLVPICHLLPSVREIHVDAHRGSVKGYGFGEYLIGLPAIVRALEQSCRPLRAPVRKQEKLITITLREAAHHPLRNSRTEEWVKAADALRDRGYLVLIIRDTLHAYEKAGSHWVDPTASQDIPRRAHLYANAALNIGISNGPMWLAVFMGAPVLMLRPTTNAAMGCYDDRFYARHGVRRGSQLPSSPPHQRLCWEEDYCDNIVATAEEMLANARS